MESFDQIFSIQVFFLVFRETVETAVIVSVLLAFIKHGFTHDSSEATSGGSVPIANKQIYNTLKFQIWAGAFLGLFLCLIVGSIFIFAFYYFGQNLWDATEKLWEATFSILASLMISVMGLAMIRINKMREKWRVKIAQAIIEAHKGHGRWGLRYLSRKYALAILPMITTLREGLEAIVFLGGIGVNQPMSGFPLAVICALLAGIFVGWLMYRGGNQVNLQYFMIGSTCLLYLVAAGLFSKGVWFFELQGFLNEVGYDISETGSGPGSYDIRNSVWHVNCCNGQTDGFWMLFNAIFGWQNSATYGSVISYNLYWYTLIAVIFSLQYQEKTGYLPLIPHSFQDRRKQKKMAKYRRWQADNDNHEDSEQLIRRATALYAGGDEESVPNRASLESQDSSTPLVSNEH